VRSVIKNPDRALELAVLTDQSFSSLPRLAITPEGSTEPMKKLHVICFLFDPITGGPTIRARAVYERMIADGYEVRVAFPLGEGSAAGYIAESGIPVDRLMVRKPVPPSKPGPFLKFAFQLPLALWRTVRYLKQHKPDVIHVNGAFDIGPALAGRIAGVPVVWHLNDTIFSKRFSRLLGVFVKRTAMVVVAAAERVAEHYGVSGGHTVVIHAPVNVERFTRRDPDSFPRAEPVLGLLGNWNWVKGQDRFVETIQRLRDAGSPVRGRAMGKFPDSQKAFWEPVLATIEASGLEEVIERPGFVENTAAALRDIDILLLTSHSEASPICVHEAMSIGIPQVVFDVGGVREMLGDGDRAAGMIVPEGDVGAMTAAVERLLADASLYARMALNGQKRARAYFSLEACIARHEAAYADAVSRYAKKRA